MRTIALRFAENFAPEGGTIAAHQEVIDREGSVWYGKFGSPISMAVADAITKADDSRILLVRSGGSERWWAHLDEVQRDRPEEKLIPPYYDRVGDKFSCWFHVTKFERASKDVMQQCIVVSSGRPLSNASRHSMSPYFIIDYNESQEDVK